MANNIIKSVKKLNTIINVIRIFIKVIHGLISKIKRVIDKEISLQTFVYVIQSNYDSDIF